jgi:hypothetical protein
LKLPADLSEKWSFPADKIEAVLAKPLADFGGVRFPQAFLVWLETVMPDIRKLAKVNQAKG